ncbi:MAG: biotin--[Muribaculaceae bacterium]|nr:biotin--[acetyl-CoA-carboxylase] ligase [Muribaculaceae bacterium]
MSKKTNIIHLDSIGSTNTYLAGRAIDLPHATVVSTYCQTAGRGQRGNTWESQPNKNLSFSVLLRPNNIIARQQFYISEAVSVAIINTLTRYITNHRVAIKWPNDIYVDDHKICGILIENTLCGMNISQSIVGVGLNVNQREFISDAPNPISIINYIDKELSLDDLLEEVTDEIVATFDHYDATQSFDTLHKEYCEKLWRNDGYYTYSTPQGEKFDARIADVAPDGILTLCDTQENSRSFAFKEVMAIL